MLPYLEIKGPDRGPVFSQKPWPRLSFDADSKRSFPPAGNKAGIRLDGTVILLLSSYPLAVQLHGIMATAADDFAYQLAHINESRKGHVIAVNAAMITVSTVSVTLRFVSRRLVNAPIKYDDYAILVALVRMTVAPPGLPP